MTAASLKVIYDKKPKEKLSRKIYWYGFYKEITLKYKMVRSDF